MLRNLFIIVFLFLFSFTAHSESSPKREFRGVWIASVGNIDWPSKSGLSAEQQRQEFINKLNFLQRLGFNAVIVQVRPAADALYDSPYEPWSKYLSGKQGVPPFPKYDPLTFMIQETHKRNMEFHAWLNPYRALVNASSNPNPASHVTRTHPDWVIKYGTKAYFDPGNPECRNYILKVFLDVVKRYDIDALHIDDYFYPYPEGGKDFPDGNSYARYGNGMTKADWRRNNVNTFISQLNRMIKEEKPYVAFGVSPFGIWRNDNKSSEGSATRGTACYDDLYSDVRLWLEKKWVDYVAPQLYWEHYHKVAPFNVLLPWWTDNSFDRNLYIGLGVYRMAGGTGIWSTPNEILKQIRAARSMQAGGVIMYSLSSFDKINSALADSLRKNYFNNIAIPPVSPHINKSKLPPTPTPKVSKNSQGAIIEWGNNAYDDKNLKFLVYRFVNNESINLENSENIIGLTQNTRFVDDDIEGLKNVRYIITSLSRTWVESKPSEVLQLK